MTRAIPKEVTPSGKPASEAPRDAGVSDDYSRLRKENLLSFIVVSSRDAEADAAEVEMISRFAGARFDFYEILIVASLPVAKWRACMKDLGIATANARVISIDTAMSYEELSNAALRHAIGDYVISLYPGEVSESDVESMVKLCATGTCDIVKSFHDPGAQPMRERFAASVIRRVIWLVTGHEIQAFQARAFALNRTALSRLQAVGGALKFFRILDMSGHLSEGRILIEKPVRRHLLGTIGAKIRLAAVLVSTSAPRLILSLAMICFILSLASVLFAVASVVIWLFKEDIAPGWTSLSTLFSLLFAANFGVLAAICLGLLQLIRQGTPDAVDLFTTELSGGDFFRKGNRLNVEAGTLHTLEAGEEEG